MIVVGRRISKTSISLELTFSRVVFQGFSLSVRDALNIEQQKN